MPEEVWQALRKRSIPLAIDSFRQLEKSGVASDASAAGRWEAYMLAGNFEKAWQEADILRSRNAPDPHRYWNSQPIDGRRAIVRCLHGLGDAIQFLRYAPHLRARAAQLIVQVPPRFVPLAASLDGIDYVVTWDELLIHQSFAWEVQIEVMELPYLFRTTLSSVPCKIPYLFLPPAILQAAAEWMRNVEGVRKPRVGVCWSCGSWNPSRAIPLELLKPLFRNTDVYFYNLQDGREGSLWNHLDMHSNGLDTAHFGEGLIALAAVVAKLDVIITVDTMVAHLAGALGKPVWLALQYAADWRWMQERVDSPWYPTMRIFRQPIPGDWHAVIASMKASLDKLSRGLSIA